MGIMRRIRLVLVVTCQAVIIGRSDIRVTPFIAGVGNAVTAGIDMRREAVAIATNLDVGARLEAVTGRGAVMEVAGHTLGGIGVL